MFLSKDNRPLTNRCMDDKRASLNRSQVAGGAQGRVPKVNKFEQV